MATASRAGSSAARATTVAQCSSTARTRHHKAGQARSRAALASSSGVPSKPIARWLVRTPEAQSASTGSTPRARAAPSHQGASRSFNARKKRSHSAPHSRGKPSGPIHHGRGLIAGSG